MNFFKQLRERRLFQIGLSYAGVSWAVMEVTDQLAGRELIPDVLYNLVLIWVLVGIPAVLLIGWHHGEKGEQKAPPSEIAILVLLAVVAIGMSTSTVSRERALQRLAVATDNPLEQRSIVVLYFEDHTDGEFQHIADGLTEELIAELSQVQALRVASRNASALFRDEDVPVDSIARALGAGTIVAGSLDRRGSGLRLNLRIHEGQSGGIWKRTSVDLDPSQGLAARDSVSAQVSRLLREWLGEEVRLRQTAANTSNAAAWSLLQRAERLRKDAEHAVSEREMDTARSLFQRADSLLADAAQLDRSWADPLVARANVAFRLARLTQFSPPDALALADQALEHAENALRRSRTSARALEARGNIRYLKWLLGAETDARRAQQLYEQARDDLENAVRFDPSLASAYATLSHLYTHTDVAQSVLAAQNALQADSFLESVDQVTWSLFKGQVDLGQFSQAQRTCDEASRRAPEDYRFVSCHLRLLITPAASNPSVDSAWTLLARQDELTPAPRAEFERVQGEMFVAGAIAKAARQDPALQDSARAVLSRASARADQRVDPTQHIRAMEAYLWTLVGDKDRAIATLNVLLAADPGYFGDSTGLIWWWRGLEDDPRFRRMAGID
jgi:TolB-like protein